MKKRPLIFSLLSLLLLLARPLCAEPLPVLTVRPHPVDLGFPAEAVVEAVQQATVASQVQGRVLEVHVDAGKSVRKGELLMRIDAREASENVAATQATQRNAKLQFERMQSLRKQNFVSQAAVDKAKADFDSAAASLAAAGATQSHAAIVAPMNGVVAQRFADVGDMASPGVPLLSLYDPAGLRAVASIPQYRLPQMRSVRTARIEFPESGHWVDAVSVTLLPTADAATHVTQVRVNLPVGVPEAIPGAFARVHFVLGKADKLTVPATAVSRRGEVAAVYVRSADGHLSLRQLRLGEPVGQGEIEVLAGLAAGEQIVTDPVKAGIALKAAAAAAK